MDVIFEVPPRNISGIDKEFIEALEGMDRTKLCHGIQITGVKCH